jgi:nucleoid-associated protein YgaU
VNKPVIVAIVGIIVVALAIALNFVLDRGDDDHPRPAVAEQSAPPAATKTETASVDAPSFDIVRVNPQGNTVIAGRAKPGSKVEIYEGDTKIGEVEADRRGEWVFVPDQPLTPGSRRLSLVMRLPDGSTVPATSDVVIVVPEPGQDVGGGPSQPLAMRVPKEGQPGSVEILQKPGETPPAPGAPAQIALAVDAVDYDAKGKLDIVGKAPPGSLIQLYLNNDFLGRTQSDARGAWSLKPDKTAPAGNHVLRADQIDPTGKVTGRVEVHFARSAPLVDVPPGSLVVVKEGNSLWRIARHTYGSGFRYTQIFKANKDQIRDADLIFPGQVFKLPQTD